MGAASGTDRGCETTGKSAAWTAQGAAAGTDSTATVPDFKPQGETATPRPPFPSASFIPLRQERGGSLERSLAPLKALRPVQSIKKSTWGSIAQWNPLGPRHRCLHLGRAALRAIGGEEAHLDEQCPSLPSERWVRAGQASVHAIARVCLFERPPPIQCQGGLLLGPCNRSVVYAYYAIHLHWQTLVAYHGPSRPCNSHAGEQTGMAYRHIHCQERAGP